jgi:hypothetical protein
MAASQPRASAATNTGFPHAAATLFLAQLVHDID